MKYKNLSQLDVEYKNLKSKIKKRIKDFKKIKKEDYFYELCFCICTPQTKAVNVFKVQKLLELMDFKNKKINPENILDNKNHYIRFHKTKAKNLVAMKKQFSEINKKLNDEIAPIEKRNWLTANVLGIGMKESTHFLRNIGFNGDLAILDRHILKQLQHHGAIKKLPKTVSKKEYLKIEILFQRFANEINISINELDLLFWAREAGLILK